MACPRTGRHSGNTFNKEIVVTHTHFRRIGRAAAGLLATTALAAGLIASGNAMAAAAGFDARMSELVAHVKADPNYKRIPLETTADRQWFYDQTEALYTKKISRAQYVSEGTQRFPGYEASFTACADFIESNTK
jgi:hypothetical protein